MNLIFQFLILLLAACTTPLVQAFVAHNNNRKPLALPAKPAWLQTLEEIDPIQHTLEDGEPSTDTSEPKLKKRTAKNPTIPTPAMLGIPTPAMLGIPTPAMSGLGKQTAKTPTTANGKNPTIPTIASLEELQCFLREDEDGLVALKYYAPWCKKCQRVGLHFGQLARARGDGILDRKMVKGRIRFAQVQFKSKEESQWIMKDLQVKAFPTLQIHSGAFKLWQGHLRCKEMHTELEKLEPLSVEERRAHGELVDALT